MNIQHVSCPRCFGNPKVICCALCEERGVVTPRLAQEYEDSDKSLNTAIKLRLMCAITDGRTRRAA